MNRAPIVGAHADYRETDYRFRRVRGDDTPIERTPPIRGWGRDVLAAAFMTAFVVSVCVLIAAVTL
jgi:hypothetical protein